MKVNSLKLNDPSYPELLRQIHSAPSQLFWTGAPLKDWVEKPKVAVVGSRKVTAYGREVTQRLATELARHGIIIISGLALGVDSIAHRAALEAGGTTVAVLPTSLDNIYPASHASLARQIVSAQGTLISEYPAGSMAYKQNFIARNRIVSGLADVLLITEAAAASGSLHTARFALEQGRTVMAVPGNITSQTSEGTNNLIKSGALPATSASDILFALGLDMTAPRAERLFSGNETEKKVLDLIRAGISAQEELALQSNLDGGTMAEVLTMLEINGYIRAAGGGNWMAV